MATEREILDEQHFVTDRISTQVRTIALSMIAVVWLFLSGDINLQAAFPVRPSGNLLIGCMLLSVGALVFDYLQYVAGYLSIREAFNKGPDKRDVYSYDYDSKSYLARGFLFQAKQWTLGLAVAIFFVAMIGLILT